jgi:hypothetical protein
MKRFITIIVAALAMSLALACEENPAQEYGRALTGSMDRAESVAERANLEALRRSVESHRALNGRYPESLDGIAQAMGLDPSRFDYNPSTGTVTLRK